MTSLCTRARSLKGDFMKKFRFRPFDRYPEAPEKEDGGLG